jgi:hypothetical protein
MSHCSKAKVSSRDEKISALGSMFAAQQWTQAFIDAGSLWEELKKYRSQEMDASKQIILRCYIEARIRGDKMDIEDEASIQDWLDVLYGIGGRCFDNIWLSLFATVADRRIPTVDEVREVYDRLLEDFNVNDSEKMEQLQRMNELRNLLGNETGEWWIDYAESWFVAHKNMVKVRQVKRTILTLFNLKHGEQENVIEIDPEEETNLSEWTEEVSAVTNLERKEIVSGTELDVIRANLGSIQKQIKDSRGKDKKQLKEINISCANAVKANKMLLEKLNEINRPLQKPSRIETIKRNQREEEDSTDEMNNFADNSQTQSEEELQNNMPNDIIMLKTTMLNEVNDDIKMTIPRIQRSHYAKIGGA